MTFHDSLLVSNETANLACITVNTISVCLFILFFFFGYFQCECYGGKKTLPPFISWNSFPLPVP